MMAVIVGQQFGNYRLLHLLGRGGFAEVYLGRHIHLDTLAAVKILHTQLSQADVDRFRNEARTLVQLAHPHIVRVLDYGVEGTTPFLVMDYASNGSLRQRHPRSLVLPLATVVPYVKQIAEALQYAHNGKLVHCDIKPENMLIGQQNELLLSDFGIALVAQTTNFMDKPGMAGTIAYMAPEQIQGQPQPASDQYALGAIVYEWLCGEQPFCGTFAEVVAKHVFVPPPPLREKNPSIPQEVEQVVAIALAKNPYNRFASVHAFARALEQASGALPSSMPDLAEMSTVKTTAIEIQGLKSQFIKPMHQVKLPPEAGQPAAVPIKASEQVHARAVPVPLRELEDSHAYSTVDVSYLFSTSDVSHRYSTVAVATEQPQQLQHRTGPSKRGGIGRRVAAGLVLLVLVGFVITWLVFSQKMTIVFTGTTTQTTYPDIAGVYSGPLHNTRANIFATMGLTIHQNQGSISGTFYVALPLKGNGSFTGTIDPGKHIRFVVRSDQNGQTAAPILFWGDLQPDRSLSGNYCSVDKYNRGGVGGYCVWSVVRIHSTANLYQRDVSEFDVLEVRNGIDSPSKSEIVRNALISI